MTTYLQHTWTEKIAELIDETHIRYLYQDSIVSFEPGGAWRSYEPDEPAVLLLDSITDYLPGTYVVVYRDSRDISPEWGVIVKTDETHYHVRKFRWSYGQPDIIDVYSSRRFMYVRLMDTEQRTAFKQFLWDNPTIVNVSTP